MNFETVLDQNNFFHVFQPICNISNWNIIGYEAFFRSKWNSNPEYVFQVAKKANKLFELDTKSIHSSISNFLKFRTVNPGFLFVNVFPSTLLNPKFEFFIKPLALEVNASSYRVVFEINESEKIEDIYLFREKILRLRNYNFLFAIDDVGKGVSSIPKILELEPDFIKLDQYFSNDLVSSEKKQKLIQCLIEFCGETTQVILEGIENPADLAIAKAIGVTIGQGFILKKPDILENISLM